MTDIELRSISEMFSAGRILGAVAILVIAWVLLLALEWLSGLLARRFSRYRMQVTGMFPVARILVWAIAVYLVTVDVIRPPQAQLLALLASIGLAVGLAAQDVIRNLISGILILFERPFRAGDMVAIGEHYGEIVAIGLRSVQMRTFDDNLVTIPNATVMGQSIANSNAGALDEMVVVKFTVPASLDVQAVKALAWEAAACSPYVYLKKPIAVVIEDVFDRTFLTRYSVKAYVLDVRLERVFYSDVLERIKRELIAQGLLTEDLVLRALRAPAA